MHQCLDQRHLLESEDHRKLRDNAAVEEADEV